MRAGSSANAGAPAHIPASSAPTTAPRHGTAPIARPSLCCCHTGRNAAGQPDHANYPATQNNCNWLAVASYLRVICNCVYGPPPTRRPRKAPIAMQAASKTSSGTTPTERYRPSPPARHQPGRWGRTLIGATAIASALAGHGISPAHAAPPAIPIPTDEQLQPGEGSRPGERTVRLPERHIAQQLHARRHVGAAHRAQQIRHLLRARRKPARCWAT